VLARLVADGEHAALRNGALAALEHQGPYAVAQLTEMVRSADLDVVMFAVQVLTRIKVPATIPVILPLLEHRDPNVAQAAVEALGQLRATAAIPALTAVLERGALWLQLAAVQALTDIGDPSGAPALLPFLERDGDLTEPAIEALGRLAAPQSLGALLGMLTKAIAASRREALLRAIREVLVRHPTAARAALPAGPSPIVEYLGDILSRDEAAGRVDEPAASGPRDDRGQARGGGARVRAAAELAVAAWQRALYPLLVARAEGDAAEWIAELFARHAEAAAPEVRGLIESQDPRLRAGALRVGRFEAGDLPRIRALLDDRDADVRGAAIQALGVFGDPLDIPRLIDRLHGGTATERTAAEAALGAMPGDRLAGLESFLDPADEPRSRAALAVLRRAWCPALEPRVSRLTHASSPMVRGAALRAMAAGMGPEAAAVLVRALADPEEAVQVEALELLAHHGGPRVAETLTALLSVADSLRYYVIRALGRMRVESAGPRLETLYEAAPLHEQIEVIKALGRIGGAASDRFLRQRLEDAEGEVRRQAAMALAERRAPDQLALLFSLVDDEDWSIRNEAARGLGLLGDPAGQDALLTLVRDVEPVVRRTARSALERLPSAVGGDVG
jgi:HEAT repeat protein